MTARFACDPEIGAGSSPFYSVRRDPATPGAELGEQMRQLVPKGAVDFGFAVRAKPAV